MHQLQITTRAALSVHFSSSTRLRWFFIPHLILHIIPFLWFFSFVLFVVHSRRKQSQAQNVFVVNDDNSLRVVSFGILNDKLDEIVWLKGISCRHELISTIKSELISFIHSLLRCSRAEQFFYFSRLDSTLNDCFSINSPTVRANKLN